jgi:Dockerin type I domain
MDVDRPAPSPNDPNEYQLAPQLVTDPSVVASDGARNIGEEVIMTYDWCYSNFTELERATLRARWNTWITILNAKAWGGETMPDNNYFWGYMRNSTLWGLATWGENTANGIDKAREFLMHGYNTRYLTWLLPVYSDELKGGVTLEGTAYGRVMFDYHITPFLTLRNMGENPFERTRFWKDSVYYTAYSMTPALTFGPPSPENCTSRLTWQQFPFADDERFSQCGYSVMTDGGTYASGMLTYANLWPSLDSGKTARLISRTVGQRARPWLRAYFDDTEPTTNFSFSNLPLDYFAQASRNVYTRSAWGGNTSSINFFLGRSPSIGHKHFDGGSFQWWRNGRWLSRESTGYVGSQESVRALDNVGAPILTVDVDDAVAHNTVLFEGRASINGEFGTPEGNSQMLRLFSNADFVYGASDLAPTFRYRRQPNPCRYDWPYAEQAVREFVYLREIETMVTIDRLTGSADSGAYLDGTVACYNPFTGPRRTASQVKRHVIIHGMEAFTSDNGWYLSNSGAERFGVFPLLPVNSPSIPFSVNRINERTCDNDPNTRDQGKCQGNFRLDIGASGAATLEFVNVLHASASNSALPAVTLTTEGVDRVVRIVKNGTQHEVRFQLGAVPQTTSVTIGNNTVTPPATVSPLQPAEFSDKLFDIDGNGTVDAETDGLLIVRYLLGLQGNALISGAMGGGATRTTADTITAHLQTLHNELDVDGDGQRRSSTDAVIITRYLRNVRGAALTNRVTNGTTRTLDQVQGALFGATGLQ